MPKRKKLLSFEDPEERISGFRVGGETWRQMQYAYAVEDGAKLRFLCLQYGIEDGPDMFYKLALALARELYPKPKKAGRKAKWGGLQQAILVIEVDRLIRLDDQTHGIEWACRQLAKRDPWSSFLEAKECVVTSPNPAEALRKVYFNARDNNPYCWILSRTYKEHVEAGTVSDWEAYVKEAVNKPGDE